LAPFASLVAAFLLPFLSKARTQEALSEYLIDQTRNLSPYMSTWLLAALVETPYLSPDIETYARHVARDRNSHRHLRAVASIVVARHGNEADRRWLEANVKAESDPFLARAFMVGLRHSGKLNKGLLSQVVGRHPDLQLTADFLNGRDRLPSMVYSERTVNVP
jgi:hypothetical protein